MFYKLNLIFIFTFVTLAITDCTLPNGSSWPKKGVVYQRDAMPTAEVVQSTALVITITSEKERYTIGEPVYIIVRLENKSTVVQQVFSELRPSDGATHILVIRPDGRQSTFSPLVRADNDSSVMIKLNPGETIGDVFPVFFGANGWTFIEPGKYHLTAIYQTPFAQGKIAQIKSKTLRIFVERTLDGSGEFLIKGDKAPSYEAGKFLTWQAGDHLTLGQEKLEALLNRWPESMLANYANFALGKSQSEPFMDYRKNAVRPANCEMAMSLLSQVKKNLVSRHALILMNVAQARCELHNKNWDAAREHLMQANKLVEGRPEYKAISGRLNGYEEYLRKAVK